MNQQQRLMVLGVLGALALLIYGTSLWSRGATDGRIGLHGTVTSNGAPLESGRIQFSPDRETTGPAVVASIVDGQFSIPASEGVLPGTYEVTLMASTKTMLDPSTRLGSFPRTRAETAAVASALKPVHWPKPQQIPSGETDVELNFDFPSANK